jgi:hypothetical protein
MMRDPTRHRVHLSVALLVLQAIAAVLHAVPSLVYSTTARPTTTRVVAYVSQLGPIWVLVFGITALGLLVTMIRGRSAHLAVAHLVAAGSWVMYASSLWIGALAAEPHGTVFYPCITTAMAIVHSIIASSYNDTAGREARQ